MFADVGVLSFYHVRVWVYILRNTMQRTKLSRLLFPSSKTPFSISMILMIPGIRKFLCNNKSRWFVRFVLHSTVLHFSRGAAFAREFYEHFGRLDSLALLLKPARMWKRRELFEHDILSAGLLLLFTELSREISFRRNAMRHGAVATGIYDSWPRDCRVTKFSVIEFLKLFHLACLARRPVKNNLQKLPVFSVRGSIKFIAEELKCKEQKKKKKKFMIQ